MHSASLGGFGAIALNLWETPEPGSLFLLGGVLLGLAMLVLWKAARSSKEV